MGFLGTECATHCIISITHTPLFIRPITHRYHLNLNQTILPLSGYRQEAFNADIIKATNFLIVNKHSCGYVLDFTSTWHHWIKWNHRAVVTKFPSQPLFRLYLKVCTPLAVCKSLSKTVITATLSRYWKWNCCHTHLAILKVRGLNPCSQLNYCMCVLWMSAASVSPAASKCKCTENYSVATRCYFLLRLSLSLSYVKPLRFWNQSTHFYT